MKSKLPHVGTTIFTKMSKLAHQYQAINLSQGFPNFSPDKKLISLATQALEDDYNQYAPLAGKYSLRKILTDKVYQLYKRRIDPEKEITMTAGATQAVFTAVAAMIHPGDEVIMFKPAYDCYEPAIDLNGGVTKVFQMKPPHYAIDWNAVEEMITDKTRLILLNSPHNPTGKVLHQADIDALTQLVEKYPQLYILSDEVYEHMTFDDQPHLSVLQFPKLANRAMACFSFGKTFHVTGWKLGYIIAPEQLMTEFRKVHQYNVFCVNHPFQVALEEYLKDEQNYLNLPKFYQKKRDYFLSLVKDSKLKMIPSEGSYFQLADYSTISDAKDDDFTLWLIKEKGLALIPVSGFNQNAEQHHNVRICFAKTDETLEAAAEIINRL